MAPSICNHGLEEQGGCAAPDGSGRAAEVAQDEKVLTASLRSVFFGPSPNLSTLQLRTAYTVFTKLV